MKFLPSKYSFCFVTKNKIKTDTNKNDYAPEVSGVLSGDSNLNSEEVNSDKRKFLKLAGLGAVGLIASQMLPSKANAYIMGSTPATGVVGVKNFSNTRIDPATEGTLTLIKNQTTKLNFDGSNNLYVNAAAGFASQLENASNAIINPATEDTLNYIRTQTDKLHFDGSNNLLVSGASAATTGLKDKSGTQINPATEDSLILLRRILRQVDALSVVDSAQRQKITIDAITANLTLSAVTNVGTVTTVTTVSSLTQLGGVDGRYLFIDTARNMYSGSIRNRLTFS